MLWDQWYGGKRFHQEPLYAYFLAMNYKLSGHDVRIVFLWQMILGVLTNLLIYLVARRYFGDFTATLSAVMAVFCGPLIFFELVLLRSSMTVFFGILVVYLFGVALDKNKFTGWLLSGFVTGIAILLQIYFVIFLFAGILLLAIRLRKQFRQFLTYSGYLIAGTIIALSPAFVRNAIVGVPLLSLNSNGASTFITDNNVTVRSFTGWDADIKITSEIMGSSDGHLLRAIIPTLQTHRNLAGYLTQLWGKIHATFSWFEIPNNVNFYFYREHSIVLSIAFLNFLLLTPLALTGLLLAIVRKRKAAPLYIMIIVQLIPLLGFLVLSRHRVALIPVLLPFAALTITELTGSWRGWRNVIIMVGLVILTTWSASPNNEYTVGMLKVDYDSIYDMHYVEPLKKLVDNREWKKAAVLLEDFIDRYEPRTLRNIKPFFRCTRIKEAEVYLFFSWIHSIHSQILVPTGDSKSVTSEAQISSRLKEAGSIVPSIEK
jgi:4-amino-4-deoxy-L-arabinose transferase-like glycosyltransferase